MATYTIGKGNYARPTRNNKIRPFPEAASQTFKVGDPLILQTTADKGHQVKISGADPSAGTVVGIAMAAASGTENTEIPVAMLDEQGEFVLVVGDGQTQDFDDIGDEFGIVSDSTNQIWRLDRTETSAVVFRVVAFGPKPDGSGGNCTHGDVNGAYVCTAAVNVQGVLRK